MKLFDELLSYMKKVDRKQRCFCTKLVSHTFHGRAMLPAHCVVCGNKSNKFFKDPEASGFLSRISFKTTLTLLGGDTLL